MPRRLKCWADVVWMIAKRPRSRVEESPISVPNGLSEGVEGVGEDLCGKAADLDSTLLGSVFYTFVPMGSGNCAQKHEKRAQGAATILCKSALIRCRI